MEQQKSKKFVQTLLVWALKNTRNFPWRATREPYEVLIAEIMLQRTKAEQVAPIYERFIMKYSSVRLLSIASVMEIRKDILSLGLEKRALGLKKIAKQILEQYNGKIPESFEELVKLYGVGSYIANAVLCHAFGLDVPTVDANFARVLVRAFSLKTKQPAQKEKNVWDFAYDLMPFSKGNSRVLNLGILDLASEICTPRKPSCRICPLNSICDYGAQILKGHPHKALRSHNCNN